MRTAKPLMLAALAVAVVFIVFSLSGCGKSGTSTLPAGEQDVQQGAAASSETELSAAMDSDLSESTDDVELGEMI